MNSLFMFEGEGYVYNDGNNYYFKELFSDTLFTVMPDHTPEARLIFDPGSYQPTLEEKHAVTDLNNIWSGKMYLWIIGESSAYLFFNVVHERETYTCYWDKRDHSLHNVRFTGPKDDPDKKRFVPKGLSRDKRNLITFELDTIGEDNPAIIIATLKNGG